MIPSDDELPDTNALFSPDLGCKELLVSGHGAKVKANDQTPEILDWKHNYSEGSWRLADKICVLVHVFCRFLYVPVSDGFQRGKLSTLHPCASDVPSHPGYAAVC